MMIQGSAMKNEHQKNEIIYDLLIHNAAILPSFEAGIEIKDGVIGIRNGIIEMLGPKDPNFIYQAKEELDAEGMLAIPGFVNTHVHCFQSLLKGLGADRPLIGWLNSSVQPFGVRVTNNEQELATRIACLESIKNGCTTLCEFFYTNQDPELADVCIETMKRIGVRSVFMRTFQDFGQEYNTPECYIEPVEKAIDEVDRLRRTYLKKPATKETSMNDTPTKAEDMLSIWTGPDVTWATTKRGYEAILEYCLDQNVRYTMHLKETPEDDAMCRRHYGKGIVELLDEIGFLTDRFLAVHCVYLTGQEIELFSKRGVSISHNPAANLYLGSGIAPIPKALAEGINISLGTDGAASNNTTDMMDTIRLAALIHKGVSRDATAMSAGEVLRMATIGGAKALGMERTIGTLEVGKKADIVLFDPKKLRTMPMHDPAATIVYSGSAENIDTTIINGKVVYRRGVFACGIEEKDLAESVQDWMTKHKDITFIS